MFEEYTQECLLEQAKEMGKELGVDTRQGSVYLDACMGHILRVAKFYEDLRMAFRMFSDESCSGAVLEEKAAQRRIYRKQATPSYYKGVFEGVAVSELVGDRFLAAGYYFTLIIYEKEYYLRAEIAGSETNQIPLGQPLIPVKNTIGLISATIGERYQAGTDREGDESLRQRYQEAMALPAENGNKQQYKNWCEAYEGIGKAIILPLEKGENTVVALLISSEGGKVTDALKEQIQEEIDPKSKGLGEGKAPIGCHFFAESVKEIEIHISFTAKLSVGYPKEAAIALAKKELSAYLKNLALNTSENEKIIIQYVKVIGIMANIPAIQDFSDLKLNGVSENIVIAIGSVGVLGEVELHGSVL